MVHRALARIWYENPQERFPRLHSDGSHADLHLILFRAWLTPNEQLSRMTYRARRTEEIWKAFQMQVCSSRHRSSTYTHPVLDGEDYEYDAEPAIAPPLLHDTPWQAAASTISSRLLSWGERARNNLFSPSFQYAPIEMSDRQSGSTGFQSGNIQNDKYSKHIRAGGSRITGAKVQTTNGKSSDMMEEDEPTEEELASLRKVSDHLPWPAFIVAMVELCERFTYYGLSGPFQNYIQYHPHDTPIGGGIGKALPSLTVRSNSGTEQSQAWAKLGRQL